MYIHILYLHIMYIYIHTDRYIYIYMEEECIEVVLFCGSRLEVSSSPNTWRSPVGLDGSVGWGTES